MNRWGWLVLSALSCGGEAPPPDSRARSEGALNVVRPTQAPAPGGGLSGLISASL